MEKNLKKKIIKRTGMIIGGLILAAGLALLFGFIVLHLWNWLMPAIFGLPVITYLQAWGLVLLSHILFKGTPGSGGGGHKGRRRHRRNCNDHNMEQMLKVKFCRDEVKKEKEEE